MIFSLRRLLFTKGVALTLLLGSANLIFAPAVATAEPLATAFDYPLPSERPVRILSNGGSETVGASLFGLDQLEKLLPTVTISAQDEVAAAMESYYSKRGSSMLWVEGDGPSDRASTALQVLARAGELGLDPADYQVDLSYAKASPGSPPRKLALAKFELSMSAKVLTFAEDNFRGRINPNQLSGYYDFKRKTIDLSHLLALFATQDDVGPVLSTITPGGLKFLQLASELRRLRAASADPETSRKISKVTIAMEELRWLPDDLGSRYVFINQPAFMAFYHDNDRVALSMRAVIGLEAHQTNFFQGTIKTVEYNPDWIVPQSIVENEMLPKLRRDPAYLDREGYRVSVNGKQTPSAQVDWSKSLDQVEVVQPPGPDNALGQLKILFPNRHAIYMHDTPAKNKFGMTERMFSHGCVRLADPRGMAAAVLGTSVDEVSAAIARGTTSDQQVDSPLPVYVTYFTAWPNEDGTTHYFDDVYGRDVATLAAMKATTAHRTSPMPRDGI